MLLCKINIKTLQFTVNATTTDSNVYALESCTNQ